MRILTFLVGLLALASTAVDVRADAIAVLPKNVSLDGPNAEHRLLVVNVSGGEIRNAVPIQDVEFISNNDDVAQVGDGVLFPMGNGKATITAKVGNAEAAVQVTVSSVDREWSPSFRNHVLPIFAKQGCNSGACHGALAGKGGFRLSLRGYDPATDYHTITRQARGRRIELSDPARSLLLTKPSGAVPHKGGVRLDLDTLEYDTVAQWIADGARPPGDDDPRLERLEVLPELCILKKGESQRVLVRAHYTDGRVEDVTRWAKYSSANEAVALVDKDGKVAVSGCGEGAVTAWFSSKIVIARVTVPYDNEVSQEVFAQAERRNFIDDLVLKQLSRMNIPPSPVCADSEFLRRAYIDTIGVVPTIKETKAFLADTSPDKRDRLIEHLLSRPEFVDYWSYKWSDLLLLNGTRLRPEAIKSFYQWIRSRVKSNAPWDEMVREIVTAQGSTLENGATNFYSLHQDPESMTENACQAFLGLSIGCAKCHNHPLEKWTNNQYYAMANLFARVKAKGWGGDSRSGDGKRTVYVATSGDLIQPLTGKPQPPTPLDGEPLTFDDPSDRRVHLANWMTSPENPYFARSITNRVWANFLYVGLVEQIDDLRTSNPASNEELLSACAQHLIDHQFDLKALMRLILQSKTYQRSSKPLPQNADDKRFYSRYYPRRMMAEVMLDAISQVTSVPTVFDSIQFPGGDSSKTDFYPKGTRAIQLYDAAVRSYFLETFGRNERMITCECERTDEPSMVQVLHLSNGDTINQKLAAKESRVEKQLASKLTNEKIIEEVYLAALSRRPTDQEQEKLLELVQGANETRTGVEDLYWAVLSSREFLFNH